VSGSVWNETILVADDSDMIRDLTVRALRGYGYTVLDAADGLAAMELAKAPGQRIALLVTDLVMPNMSGATLGSHMAELIPGLKVLYVSGYTDDERFREEQGTPAFLAKPFTPIALARRVRDVLDAEVK
jgi:CheY-like chemotaxis protein